jgi:hypothetical protein
MKPENWNKMTNKEKRDIAISLFQSMRGTYIVSQALYRAIEAMKKEEHPEFSNIEDMEILSVIFPMFFGIMKLEKKRKKW